MIYVLDASAILRFTDKEPGFERVRDLFYEGAKGNAELLLSSVNWGEIVAVLHRKSGGVAESILASLATLPMRVVSVDAAAAADAGKFKWNFKVPFADAFAGSLALSRKSEHPTLVTADYDFKNVPKGMIRIEFLPAK
jgi:predicted nucleic acid-binding protein